MTGPFCFEGGPKETRTPEVSHLQGLRRLRQREYCYEEGSARGGPKIWAALARKMGPQALRMNLNTLLRHGVFSVDDHSVIETHDRRAIVNNMVDYVAGRIAD